MTDHAITPEEILTRPRVAPRYLILPDRAAVFGDRAARLRQLAPGHALEPWLRFVALVADAQARELAALPPGAPPDAAAAALAREHAMPPFAVGSAPRDPRWRGVFRRIVASVAAACEPAQAAPLAAIAALDDAALEAQADKLLSATTFGLDRAAAPLIGAALQVEWVDRVTSLAEDAYARVDVPGICPCCGSRPTAGLVRIGAEVTGYRYLVCSLCMAQWHLVRIKCAHCDSTKGIHYQALDTGAPPVVKAECCDECGMYVKLAYMDKDPHVDATADDLATLSLDLLVAETGKVAYGIDLMLVHGDAED